MQEIWKRIEAGFELIHASVLLYDLQPGAADAEIQATERFLGVTFPDEVKVSYHLHNGSNGKMLIGDPDQDIYQLYSSVEMMSDWQREMDLQRQIDQLAELNRQERRKIRLQQREDWMDEDDLLDSTTHELRNEIQEVAEQRSSSPGCCDHLRALVSVTHCFLPLFSCLRRIPTETEVSLCN